MSKIFYYENPLHHIGVYKQTDVKKAPKDICMDKDNGTWEAIDVEDLAPRKRFYGKDTFIYNID